MHYEFFRTFADEINFHNFCNFFKYQNVRKTS